jgi:hypothetical protein
VAVGLTVADPLAPFELNAPGLIATLVAPVVAHVSVVLVPDAILGGFAANDVITGRLGAVTVTIVDAVTDPAAFVAVST